MNFESHAEERIIAPIAVAHDEAIDDTLELARVRARQYRRTGKFEGSLTRSDVVEVGSGRREGRIGSPLVSARVKERGAFIQAQRAEWLVFDAGHGVRKVKSVRVPATPVVTPAGQQFPALMHDALRTVYR